MSFVRTLPSPPRGAAPGANDNHPRSGQWPRYDSGLELELELELELDLELELELELELDLELEARPRARS